MTRRIGAAASIMCRTERCAKGLFSRVSAAEKGRGEHVLAPKIEYLSAIGYELLQRASTYIYIYTMHLLYRDILRLRLKGHAKERGLGILTLLEAISI